MITGRKYFVEAPGNGIACAYFGKGERTANADDAANEPNAEKYKLAAGLLRHCSGSAENANAYDEAYHYHGKVGFGEGGFYGHGLDQSSIFKQCIGI